MSDIELNRKQLEATFRRMFTFINGVSLNPSIRHDLARKGYTPAVHAEGIRLVAAVIADQKDRDSMPIDQPAIDATKELAVWNTSDMRRLQAALAHMHPEQEKFVFNGLSESSGIEGVVVVATLLDRIDALESSKARESTRDADKKAVETLASRGLDAAERARLRELVKVAEAGATELAAEDPSVKARLANLVAACDWYRDWTETARTTFKLRADLIHIGLARRQKREGKNESVTTPTALVSSAPQNGASA